MVNVIDDSEVEIKMICKNYLSLSGSLMMKIQTWYKIDAVEWLLLWASASIVKNLFIRNYKYILKFLSV